MSEELVAIAKVAKPRGLKGEVVADLLTDFPERFENTETVRALLADGQSRDLKIEEFWFQKDRIVLKFSGIDSVEAADLLRDAELCVGEDELVELATDEYFDWQLEGCEVRTAEGQLIGAVDGIMRTGGVPNLMVSGSGKELLIPFATTICIAVDITARKITVDVPEGLLEF